MSNPVNNLQSFIQQRQQISAGASVVTPTEIPLVDTAMPLSDYQVEGAKFALAKRRVLIADEMGVGKTPQAIGIVLSAVTAGHSPILFVVPPFLPTIKKQKEMFMVFFEPIKIIKLSLSGLQSSLLSPE